MDGKRGLRTGSETFAAHRPAMDRAGYRRMVEAERRAAEEVINSRPRVKRRRAAAGKGRPAKQDDSPVVPLPSKAALSRLRRELDRCIAPGSRQSHAKTVALLGKVSELRRQRLAVPGLTVLSA